MSRALSPTELPCHLFLLSLKTIKISSTFFNYNKIPAMQAEIYEANVPHISAFIPNLERFFLCFGAISPTPPIRIAIEPKFAKPHNAKEAIIKLF